MPDIRINTERIVIAHENQNWYNISKSWTLWQIERRYYNENPNNYHTGCGSG